MAKSKEEYQKRFIQSLIALRDHFLELDANELVGPKKSYLVESVINGYFGERRNRVPIKEPSMYMTNETIAEYLNDTVLSYIYDEVPEYLEIDWKERYVLKSEMDRLISDGDDSDSF
jgi:hypothetical protein